MGNLKKTCFVAISLFSLSMGSAVMAQKDTLSKSSELSEVVVTANKLPQKQLATGKVLTVIDREEIESSNGKTLGQLLTEQTGVDVIGSTQTLGTVQTVSIRGSSSGRVMILLDGQPLNDASEINGNYDLNFIPLQQVERIEILKGAQSSQYGSDAEAGVINIITQKKSEEKPFGGQAVLSGGNKKTINGNLSIKGKLGKWDYSGGYGRNYTDGFPAAYDTSGKGNFHNNEFDAHSVRASIGYSPIENMSISTFFNYNQYVTGFAEAPFIDGDNHSENKNTIVGAKANYLVHNINFNATYQYNKILRHSNDNLFQSTSDYGSNGQFVDLYAHFNIVKGLGFLQGIDYRFNSMNSNYASPGFSSPFGDTSVKQTSVYSSIFYHTGNYYAEAGGRINFHSQYGNNITYSFTPSYVINPESKVFGSISTAFKAPSLYQLYAPYYGNKNLSPEKAINYELGGEYKHESLKQRLVLFYRDVTDGIDYNYVTNVYYNFNAQKTRGIEYEISVNPIKKLTLKANYTYLNQEENTQSRTTYKDTTYKYSLRVPTHSAKMLLSYTFPQNISLTLTGEYSGKKQDVGFFSPNDVNLDAYFFMDAHISYTYKEKLNVFVQLQNITNHKFFEAYGYNSKPFLITGGVSYSF